MLCEFMNATIGGLKREHSFWLGQCQQFLIEGGAVAPFVHGVSTWVEKADMCVSVLYFSVALIIPAILQSRKTTMWAIAHQMEGTVLKVHHEHRETANRSMPLANSVTQMCSIQSFFPQQKLKQSKGTAHIGVCVYMLLHHRPPPSKPSSIPRIWHSCVKCPPEQPYTIPYNWQSFVCVLYKNSGCAAGGWPGIPSP